LVIRFELQLTNNKAVNWVIWKGLESELRNYAIQLGVEEFDLEYDDENFIKKVSLRYESEKQLCKLQMEASICAGRHGLEIEMISRKMLEYSSFKPFTGNIKFLIKLINPTKTNWDKFRNSEPHIKILEEELNIKRKSIKFNQEHSTISLHLEFPDTKSRENLSSKITSYLDNIGIKQEIIEAIELNDYNESVVDLQLYKANKLMDQADQSLRKLSKM
jgi:hypothetical protein